MIRAQGAETEICLGHGELETYLGWVDLISTQEATNKQKQKSSIGKVYKNFSALVYFCFHCDSASVATF